MDVKKYEDSEVAQWLMMLGPLNDDYDDYDAH